MTSGIFSLFGWWRCLFWVCWSEINGNFLSLAFKYCFEYTFSSSFKDKFIHNELNWAENEYTCIMTIFVGRRSTRLTILQQGSKKLWKKRDVFWLFLHTHIYIYIYIYWPIYIQSSAYNLHACIHIGLHACIHTYIHVNRHIIELYLSDFYHFF